MLWDGIVTIPVKCLVVIVVRLISTKVVTIVVSDPDPRQLVTVGPQEVEVSVTTDVPVMVTTNGSLLLLAPVETASLALTVVVVTKSVAVEVEGITTVCVGRPVGNVNVEDREIAIVGRSPTRNAINRFILKDHA